MTYARPDVAQRRFEVRCGSGMASAYALCSGDPAVTSLVTAPPPVTADLEAIARCPPSSFVIGGGCATVANTLSVSEPWQDGSTNRTGWRCAALGGSVTAHVICALQ